MAEDKTLAPAPSPAGSAPESGRRRFRRWRFWLILVLLLAAAVLVRMLATPASDRDNLSPQNPAPNGAKAVAEVLRQQGTEVILTDTLPATREALDDGGTLLFHDANGYLDEEQLGRLADSAGQVILIEPGFRELRALAPDITAAGVVPEEGSPLAANCRTGNGGPPAADGFPAENGSITRGGLAYRGPVMCYSFSTGAQPAAAYAATADGSAVVLGAGHVLSNEQIVREANAALALNTLGQNDRLVWYRPSLADISIAEEPQSPLALLPSWVTPVALWLLAVGVLAMFWKGRRLGPLVEEPLPVVVRSAETAAGRARLYQDSKSLDRAAATLRAATLNRLAAELRLGAGARAAEVVDATARHLDRPAVELDALLRGFVPRTEAQLVDWAQNLQQLEEEVTDR
ncbi:DUF4350 domain-containing protein [Crystallibacter crystallopoietes]|nr:DUF4350 domain-containing protein [Arthrobacter crystallopoietes]